jgi:hypothetical protein
MDNRHHQRVLEARAVDLAAAAARRAAAAAYREAIADALTAGVPSSELEELTGLSASHIRGIRRGAGIPPATRGGNRRR